MWSSWRRASRPIELQISGSDCSRLAAGNMAAEARILHEHHRPTESAAARKGNHEHAPTCAVATAGKVHMPKVRAMWRMPLALAYWLGAASSKELADGDDVIFLCHGTPRFVASGLEQQLRYLRRVLNLVPLAEIATSVAERRPAGCRRRAAIIFDDGARNNVSVAYPILRSLGIPATFFVCPGLIEERKWIWTH